MEDKSDVIVDNGVEKNEENEQIVKGNEIDTDLVNKVNELNSKLDNFLNKFTEQEKIINELKNGYKKLYETNAVNDIPKETSYDKILNIIKGE